MGRQFCPTSNNCNLSFLMFLWLRAFPSVQKVLYIIRWYSRVWPTMRRTQLLRQHPCLVLWWCWKPPVPTTPAMSTGWSSLSSESFNAWRGNTLTPPTRKLPLVTSMWISNSWWIWHGFKLRPNLFRLCHLKKLMIFIYQGRDFHLFKDVFFSQLGFKTMIEVFV